jgi:tRNA threonylcarbamoyladenosine biosynthesis protein TsaE
LAPGSVVALYGGLGAGKTAFVRGLAEGLHITAAVSSPTFTIVNEYRGEIPLFHFDMYRLGGPDELFEIGWEDYLDRRASAPWSGAKTWRTPSLTIRSASGSKSSAIRDVRSP